jgi:hypothetical protein
LSTRDARVTEEVAGVEEIIDAGLSAPAGTAPIRSGLTSSMMGRRTAAWLCVLLVHALAVLSLLHLSRPEPRHFADESFVSEPITLILDTDEPFAEEEPVLPTPTPNLPSRASGGQIRARRGRIRRHYATHLAARASRLAARRKEVRGARTGAEAEAERVARMFAGPNGTLGVADQASTIETQQISVETGRRWAREGCRRKYHLSPE